MKDVRILGIDSGKNSCSVAGLDAAGGWCCVDGCSQRRSSRWRPSCAVASWRWRPVAARTTLIAFWWHKDIRCA